MSTLAVVPMLNYFGYLFDAANWKLSADNSIPVLLVQHLIYTLVAVLVSALIALPLGLLIGHTNRGAFIAIGLGNLGRSLPTFGLILLLVTMVGVGVVPVLVALTVLAIPPILAQTYAGIRSVDPAAVDAAVGMGMRPRQVLLDAEVPMALPLIFSGLRSALLQVVATATVAAYASLGGLGRLLVDGLSRNEYGQIFAGAILVALLAITLDYLSAAVERAVVSPGVRDTSRRRTRGSRRSAQTPVEDTETALSTPR